MPAPSAPRLVLSRHLALSPQPGSAWAGEMVLNPGLIDDPHSGRLHMLFRATGPFLEKQIEGKPPPFPIFLGYAWSEDRGATWKADFSRPALAPRLAEKIEDIYLQKTGGAKIINHANGCIEDPRLFWLDGQCYLSAACRMFAPGPYWIHDDPMQCAPQWARSKNHPFGRAASQNVTVSVLYRVNLEALTRRDYANAFEYLTKLTDPECGENRDAVLFPERLVINQTRQYVCLHRPWETDGFPDIAAPSAPSIMACTSPQLESLWQEKRSVSIVAQPLFDWEKDRIGASSPPLKLSPTEWLLCYHGKQDPVRGYAQSFMILESTPAGPPRVKHRCPARILTPSEEWEMPGRFKTPVVFVTAAVVVGDMLLAGYGAADERVGVAWIDLPRLLDYVRRFDPLGQTIYT